MNRLKTWSGTDIVVETRGEVSSAAPEYARTKLAAVLERLDGPVLATRVTLTQEPNHAVARPSLAKATVDLNGRPVRAHVAGATMQEAVDLLQDRLRARLNRVRHDGDGHHRHPAEPGPRGGGSGTEHRPQRREVAADERRIVRHKSYSLPRRSAPDAVLDMEDMDYDFYLFTDAATGHDSAVYRDPATAGHRLAVAGPAPEPLPGLSVSGRPVPELAVAQAVSRLDLSGLPFVFFTDAATGRGNVLYHRYDGHYGLIVPAL
jgi:ribosome-associated translation inhibitor RaiA